VPEGTSFGDAAAEYRALTESAGLVDMPERGRLDVTGGDRSDFLQGMLSNDVKKLVPGTGCPSLLLTEQGKVVADVIVLATADRLILDGIQDGLAAAQVALERFIVADDVELLPDGGGRTFALLGPAAADVVARLALAVPADAYDHVMTGDGNTSVHVTRVPVPGAGGFLCRVPSTAAASWWQQVLDVGGTVPVGSEAFEVLRIESGQPRFGRDVGPETLALEAPYEPAINFRKGCYLGQEVMERVTARGHVNRKLVGLVLESETPPPLGARLHAGDRDIGWVTSAAWSWRLGRPIALGYVRREHLEPGTRLTVGAPSGTGALVRALPF
jgi:folate-binding protein YgfZ